MAQPDLKTSSPAAQGAKASQQKRENLLGLSAGLASVAVALLLVVLKLWALWATGSLSIGASLADSAMDLLMSLGAAAAIIYAARPADDDHAFGHTSVEDLTALAQALLIGVSVVMIATSAVARIFTAEGHSLAAEGLGIWVMAISIVLTLALVWWQGHVAGRTGSKVVAADRLHYLGDLLPSLGAILALFLSRQFGIAGADAVIALLACAYMLYGAWKIGKAAWDALMDRQADEAIIADIGHLAATWPGVRGYHDLKTRMAGSRIFVHLHIELDGDLPLHVAHDIGAALKRAIIEAYPQCDVIIHKDVA